MEQRDTPETVDRYAELKLEDGFVIYDRRNHQAWLQSDESVACETMA
jgi:hypothetical protein